MVEENGIYIVEVQFCHNVKTSGGEGNFLDYTDTEVRKHREQIGLETLVVYAVNDEYYILDYLKI